MEYRILIFAGLAGLLWAAPGQTTQQTTSQREAAEVIREGAADNSGINERDRKEDQLTAGQQSSKKSDMELTRKIRRDITKDHELSTNAHNVKIISQNGVVTLKGPVGNQSEMKTIHKIARQVAGDENVKNEMEIASGE